MSVLKCGSDICRYKPLHQTSIHNHRTVNCLRRLLKIEFEGVRERLTNRAVDATDGGISVDRLDLGLTLTCNILIKSHQVLAPSPASC